MTVRPLLTATALVVLLAGTACSSATETAGPGAAASPSAHASSHVPGDHTPAAGASDGTTVIDRLGLQDADAVAMVEALDASDEKRPLDVDASVKTDRVVVDDGRGERVLPIPDDKFYLSIAPYLTQTHECFAHSLSGCQGEQAGQPMHITITTTDGRTLVDKDVTTHSNGFIGFWLPRDVAGTVKATMGEHSGTTEFATAADSPTCLTTLQMA